MHKELEAVFAECRNPTHASTRAAHDQLSPILCAMACIQKQLAEHRERLLAAELSAPDPDAVNGHTERLHQTVDAIDKDVKLMITIGRRIALGMTQHHRYAGEIEETITRGEAKTAAQGKS